MVVAQTRPGCETRIVYLEGLHRDYIRWRFDPVGGVTYEEYQAEKNRRYDLLRREMTAHVNWVKSLSVHL